MDSSHCTLLLCNVQVLLAVESAWKVFPEGKKFEHNETVHKHCFHSVSQNKSLDGIITTLLLDPGCPEWPLCQASILDKHQS